ncbi:MAG: cell division protein CrgA [Acidimicrobiales bacterium]
MTRPKKTSRITPKGTRPAGSAPADVVTHAPGSSPGWMGWLIGTLFLVGLITIFSNYMSWLPSSPSSAWILAGLGFVLAGILTATRWH